MHFPPLSTGDKHVKRDPHTSGETNIVHKKPKKIKRDLHKSKETCTSQNRPTAAKKGKPHETVKHQKRST